MDSLTIELVSNASFNCYPNNSLSSFTNFLSEQIHLKGEWEVAISEKPFFVPKRYRGKVYFRRWTRKESPEEKRNFNRCMLNLDCIQVLLI